MRPRDPRRLSAAIAELRRQRDDLALGFYCPKCRALPGAPCVDEYPRAAEGERRPRAHPHRERRGR